MLKLLCDLQLVVVVMQSSEDFKVASVQSCRRLAAKSSLSPSKHSGLQWARKCQLSFTTFHSSQPLFIFASSSSTHFPSNFRIQLCLIASESIRNLPKFRKEDLLPSIIQSISWHIQSQKSSEKYLEVRTRISKIVCIFLSRFFTSSRDLKTAVSGRKIHLNRHPHYCNNIKKNDDEENSWPIQLEQWFLSCLADQLTSL